jgi:RNA polymerase sigma-70 factor (ECF subfamily)
MNLAIAPTRRTAPPAPLPAILAGDEEQRIVAAARAGDAAAFELLVHRYESRIFRLAAHITQNHEDAEEAMQDAFLKAFEHLGEFRGDSRFYTWLVRITVNQALMKLRRRRPNHFSIDEVLDSDEQQAPREIEDWGPTPEDHFAQNELGRILAAAIAELSVPCRVVFQLFDVEEFSLKEIAEMLRITVPAVKSRLLRARLRLRESLSLHFRGSSVLDSSSEADVSTSAG